MKPENFEQQLRQQPLRQLPAEWREEILSGARPAPVLQDATCPSPSGQRATGWRAFLSTFQSQLSTLLWPHAQAWAGLAAVWTVILALNLSHRESGARDNRGLAAASPEVLMVLQEQKNLLAELLGPSEPRASTRAKPGAPQPRSERRKEKVAV